MKNLLIGLVLAGAGYYVYMNYIKVEPDQAALNAARKRVTQMFDNVMAGGLEKEKTAMCLWSSGKALCPEGGDTWSNFDKWRGDRGVYEIKEYTIHGGSADMTQDPPDVTLDLTINGDKFAIGVRDGMAMIWK